jgi:hypothetical protein
MVLVFALATGCGRPAPVPPAVATPTSPQPAPPSIARPAPPRAPVSSPPAPSAVKPEPPAKAPALDFAALETRLRGTKAIGVLTKLALKNQIDDLLGQFKQFHQGRGPAVGALRERYDLLLLKVLSLLQNDDAALARDVSASREAIWAILVDPAKFAKLS